MKPLTFTGKNKFIGVASPGTATRLILFPARGGRKFCQLSYSSLAQTELVSAFNSTTSGRNASLTISKTKNKHELGAGLRYNVGMIAMPDDQGNLYYKRLYPSTFGQHFGLQTFYNYHILKNWEHLKPFLFFDLQGTFSTTRNTYPGQSEARRYGPFTWLEQYIGILVIKLICPKTSLLHKKLEREAC